MTKKLPVRKKEPKLKKVANSLTEQVQSEAMNMVMNGLQSALFGNIQGVLGGGQQVSQTETLTNNLRWYLISNDRNLLTQSYSELGIVQAAVDIPVDDALKGGVIPKTKQLSEQQLFELEAEMEQEQDLYIAGMGEKWKRLFGGGAIIVMTDQDPKTPLDMEAIKEDSNLEFRACDMWELYWTRQNTSDFSAAIDNFDYTAEYYDYYGQTVHHTRVFKLKGKEAASLIRPRLRGWGVSVFETMVRSINQYLKATDVTFEVLDEFKLDIYKIKGLSQSLLSQTGTQSIQKRIQIANAQKNYQNAIAIDSEDDFQNKELSFAGISETLTGIRMQVASDLRMPLTKLFGISASGFSSGEDDIENYNAMISSTIRPGMKKTILQMIAIRCQKMFGFVPDDLSIEFQPLRELSSEQEENVKTQKFNRIELAFARGAMSLKEYKEACNKEDLLCVQIDTKSDTLEDNRQPGEIEAADAQAKAAKAKTSATAPKEAKS